MITVPMFVWYRSGKEIDVFWTRQAAECTIRRTLHLGWGPSILFDKDGSVQIDGLHLEDRITEEVRNLDGTELTPVAALHNSFLQVMANG